ncbi:radical SAM/SPASM domain-containing protein [Nonomuraea sp. NPDC059194]|uniref:radical SAM/SPASM domain-containing protein n=1 Tax=Nonomuraea sp. NPDC059194 TaxID=3346764 RepID=UPI00369629FF
MEFLELDLTNRCQLKCSHCYAQSGPSEGHGIMTTTDWERLLDSAPAAGIRKVQFIGGEPTMHPDFARLLGRAIGNSLKVEVFTNFFHITTHPWRLFSQPGVGLATSYYSDDPAEHDRVTGRAGSHSRTRAGIIEALSRGLPLRVGIIDLGDGQRVEQARAELDALGVTRIRVDRVRRVGRAADRTQTAPNVGELCGRCGDGRASVSGAGDVRMCVLARFLPSAGNVREQSLVDIFGGAKWRDLRAQVPRQRPTSACNPDNDSNDCSPAETISDPPHAVLANTPAWQDACNPDSDGNDCSPAETISDPPLALLPAVISRRGDARGGAVAEAGTARADC